MARMPYCVAILLLSEAVEAARVRQSAQLSMVAEEAVDAPHLDNFECAVGQGASNAAFAEHGFNTGEACADFCMQQRECMGFDFTTKVKNNACRLYGVQTPRMGSGGGDSRQYCGKKAEAPGTQPSASDCFGEEKSCLFWGDPHVETFDGRKVNFFDPGNFWIVKSPSNLVSIQGRYSNTENRRDGKTCLEEVAISGSFIKHHTLILSRGGNLTWDGENHVRESFWDGDLIGATWKKRLPGTTPRVGSVHGYEVQLPMGVRVMLTDYAHHVNLLVFMRKLPGGQDGDCSDFDGDASNDGFREILKRGNHEVLEQDNLFGPTSPAVASKRVVQQECTAEMIARAKDICKGAIREGGPFAADFIDACATDACFDGASGEAVKEDAQTAQIVAWAIAHECAAPTTTTTAPQDVTETTTISTTTAPCEDQDDQ